LINKVLREARERNQGEKREKRRIGERKQVKVGSKGMRGGKAYSSRESIYNTG
jgi:hypothetical protein